MCRLCRVCGDIDDLFAYNTEKRVKIRDRRLGLCQIFMMLLILLYVGVYQVVLQLGYYEFEDAENTVRITLQEPTVKNCKPFEQGCSTDLKPISMLDYCCSQDDGRLCSNFSTNGNGSCLCAGRTQPAQNCTYMDGQSAAVIRSRSVMITTAVQRFEQELNASCFATHASGTDTCDQIWKPDNGTLYYVADIENYNIILDHVVYRSKGRPPLRSKGTDLDGGYLSFPNKDSRVHQLMCSGNVPHTIAHDSDYNGKNTTKAPCFLKPLKWVDGNDYFPLNWIFKAAELDLDDKADDEDEVDMRTGGAVINLRIVYSNFHMGYEMDTHQWPGERPFRYTYKAEKIVGASHTEDMMLLRNLTDRTLEVRSGVLISVLTGGQLGSLDYQSLLVTMTTSLALIAMTTTAVNMLAQYAFANGIYYSKALVETSVHFSDVDILESWLDEDLDQELRKFKLSTKGQKHDKIVRLLGNGWTAGEAITVASGKRKKKVPDPQAPSSDPGYHALLCGPKS